MHACGVLCSFLIRSLSLFSLFLRSFRRYDFGYLLKLVTCLPLPTTESEFFEARPRAHTFTHIHIYAWL
jgi:hypothetical protein